MIAVSILGYSRPLIDSNRFKMEFFNEIILMWALTTMVCFSPWINDIELKAKIGFFACGIVVFHFIINLSVMFCGSCKNFVKSRKLSHFKKTQEKQRKVSKDERALVRDDRLKRRSEKKQQLERKKKDDMQVW